MARYMHLFPVLCLLDVAYARQAFGISGPNRRTGVGIPELASSPDAPRAHKGSDRTHNLLEVARHPNDCTPLATTSGAASHWDQEGVNGDEALQQRLIPHYRCASFHAPATTSKTTAQVTTLTAAATEDVSDVSSLGHIFRLDELGEGNTFFVAAVSSVLSPGGDDDVTAPATPDTSVPSHTSSPSQLSKARGLIAGGGGRDWSAMQQVHNQLLLYTAVLVLAVIVFVWIYSGQDDGLRASSEDHDVVDQKNRASLVLFKSNKYSLRKAQGRAKEAAAGAKCAKDAALLETEPICLADSQRLQTNNNNLPGLVAWLRYQLCGLRAGRDGHAAVAGRLGRKPDLIAEELNAARTRGTRAATAATAATAAAAPRVTELGKAHADAARAVRDAKVVRKALLAVERKRDAALVKSRASARKAVAVRAPSAAFASARAGAAAKREREALKRERDGALVAIAELRRVIADQANATKAAEACATATAKELAAAKRERDAAVLHVEALGTELDEAIAKSNRAVREVSDALAENADLHQELVKQRAAAAAVKSATTAVEPPTKIHDKVSSARAATMAAADCTSPIKGLNAALYEISSARSAAPGAGTGDAAMTVNPSCQRFSSVGSLAVGVLRKRHGSYARPVLDASSISNAREERVRYNEVSREVFGSAFNPNGNSAARVPMLSPPTTRQASPIVAFYRDGGIASNHGRGGCRLTLVEILGQNDVWLEVTHDYIQWLFPLQQQSSALPHAPVLTTRDVEELDAVRGQVQPRVLAALAVMLSFYGLEVEQEGAEMSIGKAPGFNPRARWLSASNHNAQRLTRIIRSLRIFSLPKQADALRDCLLNLPELRGNPSQYFWQKA